MVTLIAAPAAWADGGGAPPQKTEHANQPADRPAPADPSTKVLPATSSDTAAANAFGQQGARMRAAHQAARAAAAKEAHKAADQGAPAPGARPNASAASHASATGVSHGFDRAAAGAANGQGSTHRH
jgi:phage protein D